MTRDPYHVSEAEALTAECPTCGQRPGEACVYTMPKLKDGYDVSRWSSMRKQVERAGMPTKRVHPERRAAIRARWRRTAPRPIERLDPQLLAASNAMREWDEQEFHRLRRWMTSWGHILL